MKKGRRLAAMLLCLSLTVSGFGFGFGTAQADTDAAYMQQTVEKLGKRIEGQSMFDYLSYVYMGWRTTGGSWQNQVIDTFIVDELKEAGYSHSGEATTSVGHRSINDKSNATDDDYSWVTYFDVSDLTWNPEYAKLEISSEEEFQGKDKLIDKINVEAYGFNPTTDTYLEHYEVASIDKMWSWLAEKDPQGNRINVLNGKEAELNTRVHLARNSCFTESGGTKPADAVGVTGEVVYIGTVSRNNTVSEFPDLAGDALKTQLKGKVLLSDSSLSTTFNLAKSTGAVAVMSKSSLDEYSTPRDENGQIIAPYEKAARYAAGASLAATKAQTESGAPIVEWQLSNEQYDALKELLQKSDKPVMAQNISIGDTYAMNDGQYGGKGQAVAFAEIKGASRPDERVLICAHVQEPGSNDNATGVAALLELATEMKTMIDSGVMKRPERTITFMWGDEMSMATLYLNSHSEEKEKIMACLDMDMVGEDTEKTGGVMRIEKTPDPSAVYNYTLDTLPWENGRSYDETFKDSEGNFVRLPDSHTLWGAGGIENLFKKGFYLNDVYMYAAKQVIDSHDKTFRVDVCPYEGGSDHTKFLEQNVPAMLTWHFTDYTYHSSVDTLNMSSAAEMENVGITTLATALLIANTTDDNELLAEEMLNQIFAAAMERFAKEQQNTLNHRVYTATNGEDYGGAVASEKEVLGAWHDWYQEALLSVEDGLMEKPSAEYKALRSEYSLALELRYDQAAKFAEEMISPTPQHLHTVYVAAKEATAEADGNTTYWYCKYCGKYYSDKELTQEITLADTIVKFVPDDGTGEVTPPEENNGGNNGGHGETPRTGDNNNLAFYLLIMLSVVTAAGVLYKKKD